MLTDYIIQGQVMSMVIGLVDNEDGWNGQSTLLSMCLQVQSQDRTKTMDWTGLDWKRPENK